MTTGSRRDPGKRKGGRPRLTEEDRSLWQRVASSVDPLRRAKARVPEVESGESPQSGEASPKGVARAHPTAGKPSHMPRATESPAQVPPSTVPRAKGRSSSAEVPNPQPSVHRRHVRRIASGIIEIEARLDLHGLTQSVAHAQLIAFLQSAVRRGLKTVLVITGKGASRERSSLFSDLGEDRGIGVLRRSVPRWLAEAPLRPLVVSYQHAAAKHGGEGALYVVLRRRRQTGRD